MRHINYLKIVQKSFHLAWKNKYLWWFGLFLILGRSATIFFNYSKNDGSGSRQALDFVYAHMPLVLLSVIMLLIVYAVLVILSVLGRGALIKAFGENIKGRKMNFNSAIHQGKRYFWRLFLIGLVVSVAEAVILFVFLTPITFFFYIKSYIAGVFVAALAVIILVPLLFLVAFLRIYGYLYAVLADLPFRESLENAYSLFKDNIGTSAVALLVFVAISLVLAILVGIIILPLIAIFLLLSGIFYFFLNTIGLTIVSVFGAIIVGVILFSTLSVFEVFKQAFWVLIFEEIAKSEIKQKIMEGELVKNINTAPSPAKIIN